MTQAGTEAGKRNLILHIGDPKTGTSSIQRVLQLGLVDSPTGTVSVFLTANRSANAIPVARAFFKSGSDRIESAMERVDSWLKKKKSGYLIISSEFFSDSEPEIMHRIFSERHPGLLEDARVVAYARPHVGRALSAFTERVKCGYTLRNFDAWLPVFIKSNLLDYAPRFQKWRDSFGDRFVLRPFLRSELKNGDAVTDFFTEALGPQNFRLRGTANENRGITLKALTGLREFNNQMAAAGVPAKQRIPLAMMISKGLPTASPAASPRMDRHSIEKIARAYRKDARRLDEDFFGKPLFLPELERALADAPDEPIDLSPDKHLTAEEQAHLSRQAAAIHGLLATEQDRWMRHYQKNRQRYNMGRPLRTRGGGEIQQRLQDLTALLC